MSIKFVLSIISICCVINSCSASSIYPSKGGHVHVHVFDCEIEIPNEYVLHANEQSMYRFSKVDNGVGSISIRNLDKDAFVHESIKIMDKKEIEGLNVFFLEVRSGLSDKKSKEVVVVHNNQQAITIIGDDLFLWKDFIQACKKTRQSELTNESEDDES